MVVIASIAALSLLILFLVGLVRGPGGIAGEYEGDFVVGGYQPHELAAYWLFIEDDNTCSAALWVRKPRLTTGIASFTTLSTGRYEINGSEVTLTCLQGVLEMPSVDAEFDGKTLTTEGGDHWVRR